MRVGNDCEIVKHLMSLCGRGYMKFASNGVFSTCMRSTVLLLSRCNAAEMCVGWSRMDTRPSMLVLCGVDGV